MKAPEIIVLAADETIVPRSEMLFCLCRVCANEINWRHFDASYLLTGQCCCHAYWAEPIGSHMISYLVRVKPANMENVFWMNRATKVPSVA